MCPYALHGLGRLTQRHHSLTSNLLPNWVIPLSAASKLHFCCFFFFLSLSSYICSVGAWTGFHWLPRRAPDWTGTVYLWGRRGLYAAYQAFTQHAPETRIGEASVSGREGNPAQRGTTEIRRYPMQQHRRARNSSSGRLVIIMQMVLVVIVGLKLIYNVAYMLKIDWMCIFITQETEDVPITPL